MLLPATADVPRFVKFIREVLPKEGVNTLVIDVDYRYQFTSHPEVRDKDPWSADNVKAVVQAAHDAGVKLIPQVNLLGHQSWAETTYALVRTHPEFDETPGLYPENKGIYCRSYCPRHPQVHAFVFDLIDELMTVFGSDTFHAGMDEVFLIGEDACPRCKGANKAALYAAEVRTIHDHLASKGWHMWMWGDRLIDGEVTGIGEWEASKNGTAPAIADIPRDIVICDWHYESAHPTMLAFALAGFPVLTSSWRQPDVAVRQVDMIRLGRAEASPQVAARLNGVLHTTWSPFAAFSAAYWHDGPADASAVETMQCFREVMRRARME
jgi:hypothetical protein